VIRRDDRLLVFRGYDPAKREEFYRPLGGGIEFGEPAEVAVRRELREELGVTLESVRLLGVLENLFTHADEPGHEIVFVFSASVPGHLLRADLPLVVLDEGSPVEWVPWEAFDSGARRLYPTGLADLLRSAG
jgi:ADP-ribose pyrophosphatase YjhB (NUDIX family)